jgi:hypothetical protein
MPLFPSIAIHQDHPDLFQPAIQEIIGNDIKQVWTDETGLNTSVRIVKSLKICNGSVGIKDDMSEVEVGEFALKKAKNIYADGALERERVVLNVLGGLEGKVVKTPALVGVVEVPATENGNNTTDDTDGSTKSGTVASDRTTKMEKIYILRKLPGVNGADLWTRDDLDRQDRLQIAHQLGGLLRTIHDTWKPKQLCMMRCDPPMPPSEEDFEAGSRGWLRKTLESCYEPRMLRRAEKEFTEEDKKDEESEVFEALENLRVMKEVAEGLHEEEGELWKDPMGDLVLVHGDFMLPNMLFETKEAEGQKGNEGEDSTLSDCAVFGGLKWSVSSVLDWGDAGYGDRRYDLGSMLWSLQYNERMRSKRDRVKWVEDDEWDLEIQKLFLEGYGLTYSKDVMARIQLWMNLYDGFDFFAYQP